MKKLIRKIMLDCPVCGRTHEVEEYEDMTYTIIKGEKIEHIERYFVCPDCNDEDEKIFCLPKQMDNNLLIARNEYRKRHGLLTSEMIVDIRKKYDLTQAEFAKILGWGEATVARYETKAIQDETFDSVMRLFKNSPYEALKMLEKNRQELLQGRYEKIRKLILHDLENGDSYIKRQNLLSIYAKYEDRADLNGNSLLDTDKIVVLVNFFAINKNYLYKIFLMKELWYADALMYKKHGRSITGLVYRHKPFGALPVGHNEILELEGITYEEELDENNVSYRIIPDSSFNINILSEEEREIAREVLNKFQRYDSKAIVGYMHDETAYKKTNDNDYIPFALAGQIRDF